MRCSGCATTFKLEIKEIDKMSNLLCINREKIDEIYEKIPVSIQNTFKIQKGNAFGGMLDFLYIKDGRCEININANY